MPAAPAKRLGPAASRPPDFERLGLPTPAAVNGSGPSAPGDTGPRPPLPSTDAVPPTPSLSDGPRQWPPPGFEIEPLPTGNEGAAFDALFPAPGSAAAGEPLRPPTAGESLGGPAGSVASGSASAAMLGAAPPRPVWDLLRIPLAEPAGVPAAPLADLPGLFEPPPVNLWEDHSAVRASGVGIEAPRPPEPAPAREHSSWNPFEDDEPPPPPPPGRRLTVGHVVALVAFVIAVTFIAVFVVHSHVSKTPPQAPATGTAGLQH
jgi:hypothetical protein